MEVLFELDENAAKLVSVRATGSDSEEIVERETQVVTLDFEEHDGPRGENGAPAETPTEESKPRTPVIVQSESETAAKGRPRPAILGASINNTKKRGPAAAPNAISPKPLPFLVDIRNRGAAGHAFGKPASSPVQPQQHTRQLPFLKEINWRRRGSQSGKKDSTRSAGGRRGAGNKMETRSARNSAEFQSSPLTSATVEEMLTGSNTLERSSNDEIKWGNLTKSSQHRKNDSKPGPKQRRKFRLTSEALEYYHISQAKLRRSYPLISVESIEYNKNENPLQFKLVFPNYFLFLLADSQQEAQDWVDSITAAWSKWKAPAEPMSPSIHIREEDMPRCSLEPEGEDEIFTGSREPGEKYVDIRGAGDTCVEIEDEDEEPCKEYDPKRDVCVTTPIISESDQESLSPTEPPPLLRFNPGLDPSEPLTPIYEEKVSDIKGGASRGHSKNKDSFRRRARSSDEAYLHKKPSVDIAAFSHDRGSGRRKKITRQAFRLAGLRAPTFERATVVFDPERDYDNALEEIHGHSSMIKYPNSILRLPSEKTFVVDKDNLILMWKSAASSRFSMKDSLSLRKVVEIRQGQETVRFDKFPYDQVVDKSFSLLYESENNKFTRLDSIDIICEADDVYNGWIQGLQLLVSSSQWLHLYPPRYEDSDPTILWLKQLWRLKSDSHMDELKQADAIKMAKTFIPHLTAEYAKLAVSSAHFHQLTPTSTRGYALRWDGFVLMFNILCHTTDLQLYKIYLQYAKDSPSLGLTLKEFRQFLIEECYWNPEDCTVSRVYTLMKNYDEHHQAVKKYDAKNKPKDFQKAAKLMSFRGMLSFLRSKNNSIINLEHETVYQDMTQPLSHYFINSSHNTYLEGDQLAGTSSTDAYVRALLQGCRCVEIDCWDDTLNVNGLSEREPIIYHGHTLTTKIPFRNVVHTINDYGFHSSFYPIIISVENHCSSSQQSKMAKIFRAVFAEKLPQENLVELENRERLPSPEELQGKIILKGSFSKKDRVKLENKKKLIKMRTQASAMSVEKLTDGPKKDTISPLTPSQEQQRQADKRMMPDYTRMDSIAADDQDDPFPRHRPGSLRRKNLEGYIFQKEQGQDDQELTFTETGSDLLDLIQYCRSISIKPWTWEHQKKCAVSEMFSFGEPTINELSKRFPQELLSCSERHIVRSYPKGTRFDSSNYDPMPLWAGGVQLVALNFQKPDIHMHLNQGFFRNNGGCGYVLKPEVMRCKDPENARDPYRPDMRHPHPKIAAVGLEIELLSGQKLSFFGKKSSSLTVDISTYGIKHDCTQMKSATHNYHFWPTWGEGEHVLQHTILMPELCLVYFRVELDGRRKLLGQNCFPVVSLNPGIKFVPMRTGGGELIPESGLFVRIKKIATSTKRPTSPISGGVESSQQLFSHNPGISLPPMGAGYFRTRFAESQTDEMDCEDEVEILQSVSENYANPKRRVTSPAILQKQRKNGSVLNRDGAVSSAGSNSESVLSAGETRSTVASPNNTVEVEVDIHEDYDSPSQQ